MIENYKNRSKFRNLNEIIAIFDLNCEFSWNCYYFEGKWGLTGGKQDWRNFSLPEGMETDLEWKTPFLYKYRHPMAERINRFRIVMNQIKNVIWIIWLIWYDSCDFGESWDEKSSDSNIAKLMSSLHFNSIFS